jgi:transposase
VTWSGPVRTSAMRTRHRVWKLLLRHGHVYYGGATWSAGHDAWLHRIRFEELVPAALTRPSWEPWSCGRTRDRVDDVIAHAAADSEFTDVTRRLCCPQESPAFRRSSEPT